MVNFLHELIIRHSHYTSTLTDLISPLIKFKWTPLHQKAFEEVKQQVMKATMLVFPNYNKPFHIFTDASKQQIGAVITQQYGKEYRPLSYFSKKMNPAQQKYTVMEQELLSIVETLRAHRTMLKGYEIIIHTDHKNLTFERFKSDRVTRWRLFVEEFHPMIEYVPGQQNILLIPFHDSLLKIHKMKTRF